MRGFYFPLDIYKLTRWFSRYTDQAGNPWKPHSAFDDVPAKMTTVSVDRWRSTLEPFEIAFAESVIGDMLASFGYEPSGIKFSAGDLSKMWDRLRTTPLLHNRLKRWLETGEGVESYPSEPTNPANWERPVKVG